MEFNRAPGTVYRELLPGFPAFDCEKLRATISPAACAESWRSTRYIVCSNCLVGHVHASKPGNTKPPQQSRNLDTYRPCIRCGKSGRRLVGRVLCVSCWNRARECLKGKNGKGAAPQKWPSLLRGAAAIVAIDDPAQVIRGLFGCQAVGPEGSSFDELRRRSLRLRRDAGASLPRWQLLDHGHLWIEFITTGAPEIEALVGRLVPDGKVIAVEVGPSLAEQHSL